MTKLTILTPEDKLTEIRRLYFSATKRTIGDDFFRALQLLKSMNSEEEREKAAVYMEGLNEMRADWAREGAPPRAGRSQTPGQKAPKTPRPKAHIPDNKDPRRGR
jgi:hypothetical protein